MTQRLNIIRLSHYLIIITIMIYGLIVGRFFLMPIAFSIMFMFILKPLCEFFEKYIKSRTISILLSYILTLIPVGGVIWIFSTQAFVIFRNLPSLGYRLQQAAQDGVTWISKYLPIETSSISDAVNNNIRTIVDTMVTILTTGFNSSTAILTNLFLVLLFTFFMLYYRTSIKEFIIVQTRKTSQHKTRNTLREIQTLIMKYCYGMFIVIGILAVLNSAGLYLIGIKYALFWGLLAAFLAIIPFVGTTLGGLLPFIYAIATTETLWQPAAVVIFYASIQQIEANFITPNVVGNSIRINPFVAIIAMLFGGTLWGLGGLVLALPVAAVIKLLLENSDPFRGVALLMESDLANKQGRFKTELDEDRYRLSTLIKKETLITTYNEEEE